MPFNFKNSNTLPDINRSFGFSKLRVTTEYFMILILHPNFQPPHSDRYKIRNQVNACCSTICQMISLNIIKGTPDFNRNRRDHRHINHFQGQE